MARLERIVERLELKEFQLRALLDVTKAINSNLGREDLLQLYERIVREDLGITRLMLFERVERWERILAYGNDDPSTDLDTEALFSAFTDIQVIGSGNAGNLGAFDVAVPVFHREKPLAFLLIGDIDEEEQRMSPTVKHLNFIQTLTNLIVVAMENRRLAQQELVQERARRELELAAEMQAMLIPRDLPDTTRFEAAGWYHPHGGIGGDYYDLISLGPDQFLACVADVSGKGIAAALLMSNFQANLRAHAHQSATDLEGLIHILNERVQANARGERFITLFLAHIDLNERRLRFVNAGHNPALLYHSGHITQLKDGSIALGMLPKLPFLNVGEAPLPSDSTLLCYTDGIVEQEDAHGKAFDQQPLENALVTFSHAGAAKLNASLIAIFENHRGAEPYLDDIALLTIRVK